MDVAAGGEVNVANAEVTQVKRTAAVKAIQNFKVITDSNGREAMAKTIGTHIPRNQRESYDITVVVAYTIRDALHKVRGGGIETEGATGIIDNLTNEIRGTRAQQQTNPEEVALRLRQMVGTMRRPKALVVCEPKPMLAMDVTPFLQCHPRQMSERRHLRTLVWLPDSYKGGRFDPS
jgi:hypothetical protein